jgi:type VI secretion system protein ImpL
MLKTWWIGLIVITLSLVVVLLLPGRSLFGVEPFTPLAVQVAVPCILMCGWGLAMLIVHRRSNQDDAAPLSAEDEDRLRTQAQSDQQRSSMALRFERQMDVLREHLPGRRSGHYAYHLPWYLLLGPEGVGKTTLLTKSDQDFPLSHLLETDPLAAVTPTRDMPAWVTNDAVYIDTPGGIFGQSEQAKGVVEDLWKGVIGTLRRYRDRRPINGLLLVLSMEDLLLRSEYERAREAREIRHRVLDLMDRLGTRFPIYVIFSKTDMLAGFVEFFDDLRRYERSQVWGMSFDTATDRRVSEGEWAELFQRHYTDLTARLNERVLKRLSEERDLDRRCMIQGFPQRFGGIRPLVADMLAQIFVVDRYTTPPMLRGVYFTSSQQVGVPYDPLMGAISTSFDVESRPLAAHRSGPPFFVAQLFKEVFTPEAGLATDNRRVERKKAWSHRAGYAAAGLLTLGIGLTWWQGFHDTRRALHEATDKLDIYGAFVSSNSSSLAAAVPALNALNAVEQRFEQETSSVVLASLTLAPAPALADLSRQAYQASLRTDFAGRLANQVAADLRRAVERNDSQRTLDSLRVYLMLMEPEHRVDATIVDYAKALWSSGSLGGASATDLLTHLQAWLALRPQQATADSDTLLIAKARRLLSETPRAKRVYDKIKADGLRRLVGTVEVDRESGPLFSVVFSTRQGNASHSQINGSVPRLFTEEGWKSYFDPQATALSQSALQDSWILGDIGEGSLEDNEFRAFQREIGEYYMRDYVEEWKSLLDSLEVRKVEDLPSATRLLEAVSSPTSPLQTVLTLVSRNTHLRLPEPGSDSLKDGVSAVSGMASASGEKLEQGVEKALALVPSDVLAPSPSHRDTAVIVDAYFAPLNATLEGDGNTSYAHSVASALNDLYSYTREISDSVDPAARALEIVRARAQGRNDDPINRLRMVAASAPPPLRSWLDSIADQTWAVIMASAEDYLNDQWNSQVYTVWKDKIAGRYPIERSSQDDIPLSDLAAFLGPSGVLEHFYQTELAALVDPTSLRPRVIDGLALTLNPAALQQIHYARMVRRALFSGDGALPTTNFTLTPNQLDPTIARAILTVEGQAIDYRHGPARNSRMVWPAPDGTDQSELRFQEVGPVGRVLRLDAQGPWSWFRLLDKARIETTKGHMRVTFTISERNVSYDLWVDRQDNPFLLPTLHTLDLPPTL